MTVSGEPRHSITWWALRGAAAVVVVLLLGYVAAWALQRKLIYQPDTGDVPPVAQAFGAATDLPLTAREVKLETEDNLIINAWLVSPAAQSARDMIVLFLPGNAGNRADRTDFAALLLERGFTVLMLDYRGYGGNPGSPTEFGLAADAQAAAEFLVAEGFTAAQTIYFGESMGGAVAARLQYQLPPAGIVLRSPFTSLAAVVDSMVPVVPVTFLLKDQFPVTSYLADSDVPTTVIWGSEDSLIDPSMSAEVADSAGNLVESLEIPGANHNDAVLAGPQVADAVVRLADAISA